MQLLLPSTEKLYISLNALIKNVNKTAIYQKYNVVKKRGNKKDKNREFRKIHLKYSKKRLYKEQRTRIKHRICEKRRQCTNCP